MEKLNWIDFVTFAVLFFYGLEGFSVGFLRSFLDLGGFLLSFLTALKFYSALGNNFTNLLSLPQGISSAIGFFVIAFICEISFGLISRKFLNFKVNVFKALDRVLGVILGMLSGLILIAFLLILIIALPVSSYLKNAVFSSRIGSLLVSQTQGFEKILNNVFGQAVNETLTFLTVEPDSNSTINLHFKTDKISVDEKAEKQMFDLVNNERSSRGITGLDSDSKLQNAARKHCIDMIKRGYFSHFTPEGLSPFDRMNKGNIAYIYAGENLAFSPSVTAAMQGLMNSPGHKANILSKDFGKIGIGAINAGIFGEAFCQEFTD